VRLILPDDLAVRAGAQVIGIDPQAIRGRVQAISGRMHVIRARVHLI